MKWYSEVTKKLYDTQEECENAEKDANSVAEKEKAVKEKFEADIALAKSEYEAALKAQEEVKEKVTEILNASNKKCEDMLKEANARVYDTKDKLLKLNNEYIVKFPSKCNETDWEKFFNNLFSMWG